MLNYHPDKKGLAEGKMSEKEIYLRDEITKTINQLMAELKGFSEE